MKVWLENDLFIKEAQSYISKKILYLFAKNNNIKKYKNIRLGWAKDLKMHWFSK